MKITFKVSSQKEGSVVSLIKEVNKISCRIYLDLELDRIVTPGEIIETNMGRAELLIGRGFAVYENS